MAAVTATVLNPLVVEGNLRTRIVNITANASNNDTYTSTEHSQVLFASFTPDASGVTHGLTITSNNVITFKLSGAAKGLLLIKGF